MVLRRMRQRQKAKKMYYDKIFQPRRLLAQESSSHNRIGSQIPTSIQKHVNDINEYTSFITRRQDQAKGCKMYNNSLENMKAFY